MDENVEQTTEVREHRAVDRNGNAVRRQTVATHADATADSRVVASRAVWYIAGFIIALLAIRLVLFMFAARDTGFADFIYMLSGVFAAPFNGIFPTPQYGAFAFDTASVVGIAVYSLVAWGISKLFTISRPAGSADV